MSELGNLMLPQRFDELTEELAGLQAELDAIYIRLVGAPSAELEVSAAALRQRRAELLERWGLTALAWIARGGEVRLVGGPAAAPAAEPPREGAAPGAVVGGELGWLDEETDDTMETAPAAASGTAPSAERVAVPGAEPATAPSAEAAPADGAVSTPTSEAAPADGASAAERSSAVAVSGAVGAPAVEEPAPEPPPVTDLDLARLRESLRTPSWNQQPASSGAPRLQQLLKRVGPPEPIPSAAAAAAELSRLEGELGRLARWQDFPRDVQRALVGLFATRLRYLQDELDKALTSGVSERLSRCFPRLTKFSSTAQPGFVWGLGRDHKPEHGSWLADAREWWASLEGAAPEGARGAGAEEAVSPERALDRVRKLAAAEEVDPEALRSAAVRALDAGLAPDNRGLVKALRGHMEELKGDRRLKQLRKAIRRNLDEEAAAEDSGPPPIPPDWPYLALTRGVSAVIVGGDSRGSALTTIQEALGFGELSWESGYDIRAVQALAERIKRGGVDFVLFLQSFISHKVTAILVPACKAAAIQWVMVEHGYGLTRVKLAIERHCEAPGEP